MSDKIKRTSSKKLNHELDLESLEAMDHKDPYKVINNKIPSYIFDIIPFKKRKLDTRNLHNLPHLKVKYIFYKNVRLFHQEYLSQAN